jgi:hypothetical protein
MRRNHPRFATDRLPKSHATPHRTPVLCRILHNHGLMLKEQPPRRCDLTASMSLGFSFASRARVEPSIRPIGILRRRPSHVGACPKEGPVREPSIRPSDSCRFVGRIDRHLAAGRPVESGGVATDSATRAGTRWQARPSALPRGDGMRCRVGQLAVAWKRGTVVGHERTGNEPQAARAVTFMTTKPRSADCRFHCRVRRFRRYLRQRGPSRSASMGEWSLSFAFRSA